MIKNVERIKEELRDLDQALRLMGCKWNPDKRRVVNLDPDDLPHPNAPHEYRGKSVFKIKVKAGKGVGIQDFKAKPAQLRCLTAVYEDMALGLPVFIIILKARQIGFSTMVALLFLGLSMVKMATDVIVAAHIDTSANKIFAIYKLAYRMLPDSLKPAKEHDNRTELKFLANQSQMKAFVAKEGNMGVSSSYTHAHLSEAALWKDNPGETLATALDSIPLALGVIVFMESTSRGKANLLYDTWEEATEAWKDPNNRGVNRASQWRPMFFAWQDDEEYQLPVTNDFKLTQEEQELQWKHGLTKQQLAWRRAKIEGKKAGLGEEGAKAHFNRENPTTPEDAFRAGGEIVFNPDALTYIRKTYGQKADVFYTPFLVPAKNYHSGHKPLIQPDIHEGALRIYRKPEEGVDYLLCADPTRNEGKNPDDAALHVIDTRTVEAIAAYSLPIDPEDFARVVAAVGWYYNYAYAVVESNNAGITTCRTLYRELGYTNMHMHTTPGKVGQQSSTTLGFSMKGEAREECIKAGKRFVREGRIGIYDLQTLDEMEAFRLEFDKKRNRYKAGAPSGKQDNLVLSLIMGIFVGNTRYNWYKKPLKNPKIPVEVKGELQLHENEFIADVDLRETPPRPESLLSDN